MNIRPMTPEDWDDVAEIYRQGIRTGVATFETNVPTWTQWNDSHLADCRFILENKGRIAGYSALTPVSSRCVYRGVAEVSIYVAASARGQGVGRALLAHLIPASEQSNLWTLQASIMAANERSIKLHTFCGFRQVGYRERIGEINGIWHDVVLMERRSQTVGV